MSRLFAVDGQVESSAEFSENGLYRYELRRTWDSHLGYALFIGLNPSTADATTDDPTIRRCIRFAREWGYGGLVMANIYALRGTDPQELIDAPGAGVDPVGPRNDEFLERLTIDAGVVVAAWGAHPTVQHRAPAVVALVNRVCRAVHVLGLTAKGQPRHPLYMRADCVPIPWSP